MLIFPLVLICFVGLGANVSHGVTKDGITWEKDGYRFICKVKTYNAFYLKKYLFIKVKACESISKK
jgi:hypothetical protein